MRINRGKDFEKVVKQAFEKVPHVSIDRIHDQTTGYKGSQNICDFIVYRDPNEFYIECKAVHGTRLPFANITDTQWNGLLEKSKIEGVYAGVLCWYIDYDCTYFFHIDYLAKHKANGHKSMPCPYLTNSEDFSLHKPFERVPIRGVKRRIFFNYNMEEFLDAVQFDRWSVD